MQYALKSTRIVTPSGVVSGAVLIDREQITDVVPSNLVPSGLYCKDLGTSVIAPGLIDPHVHINEPGRAEWEGFETATTAAAVGGITTLIDMPLNSSPVTIDVESLAQKRQSAASKCHVDVGFYGGLVPGNSQQLNALIDQGVMGIKAFLCDSGLPEFPASGPTEINAAMAILAEREIPLLVHAEVTDAEVPIVTDPRSYRQFSASRPPRWEALAIDCMLDFLRRYEAPIHIVHLANADVDVLQSIREAKDRGLPLTVETCPHYLLFSLEDIPDGDPRYKCAPPIRSAENRECLRIALKDGTIDLVGSDHSPCPASMKHMATGDLSSSWGGISGLQFTLPVVWSVMSQYGCSLEEFSRWTSARPAQLVGLDKKKGSIAAGYDADLVVWNPEASFTIQSSDIRHRNGISPYVGQSVTGQVEQTYLRGRLIFEKGQPVGSPCGKLLSR